MRIGLAIAGMALLAGCGATKGPLLHAVDAAAPGNDSGTGGIQQDMPWQYQLVGAVDADLAVDLFVIDLFEADAVLIDQLHARDKLAVAYLSAGTYEPYRTDSAQFPETAIGRSLAAYPDESWLDVRDETVRALMAERLAQAQDKGFDGVLPTNLTAYQQDSGFDLSAADQDAYAAWLSAQARDRGLSIGMSGDFGRVGQLEPQFDWAVDFGCVARQDCSALATFRTADKPVFDVEVEGDAAAVCASAGELGVNAILKRPDFGAFRVGCL